MADWDTPAEASYVPGPLAVCAVVEATEALAVDVAELDCVTCASAAGWVAGAAGAEVVEGSPDVQSHVQLQFHVQSHGWLQTQFHVQPSERVHVQVHVHVSGVGGAGAGGWLLTAAGLLETETGESVPLADGVNSMFVDCAPAESAAVWLSAPVGVVQSQFQLASAVGAVTPAAGVPLVLHAQSQTHGSVPVGAAAEASGTVTTMLELPPLVVVATAGAPAAPLVVVAVLLCVAPALVPGLPTRIDTARLLAAACCACALAWAAAASAAARACAAAACWSAASAEAGEVRTGWQAALMHCPSCWSMVLVFVTEPTPGALGSITGVATGATGVPDVVAVAAAVFVCDTAASFPALPTRTETATLAGLVCVAVAAAACAAAAALAVAAFVCVTAPAFPGLPTRTETAAFVGDDWPDDAVAGAVVVEVGDEPVAAPVPPAGAEAVADALDEFVWSTPVSSPGWSTRVDTDTLVGFVWVEVAVALAGDVVSAAAALAGDDVSVAAEPVGSAGVEADDAESVGVVCAAGAAVSLGELAFVDVCACAAGSGAVAEAVEGSVGPAAHAGTIQSSAAASGSSETNMCRNAARGYLKKIPRSPAH
ncbi:MAG TPA: hypothetical protein VGF23_08430 [Gaiellaceae bacterium]